MEPLETMSLEKLLSLLQAVAMLCDHYASMTDTYALASGDVKFEKLTPEMYALIQDRESIFRFKQKVLQQMKKIIFAEYINNNAQAKQDS